MVRKHIKRDTATEKKHIDNVLEEYGLITKDQKEDMQKARKKISGGSK
ncbi:MAG: hypothetical protein PWQ63_594 [Methanolobus sp.]|jgi:hypothetical protein|nr:hypothetical protein [Methanolobus sp.]